MPAFCRRAGSADPRARQAQAPAQRRAACLFGGVGGVVQAHGHLAVGELAQSRRRTGGPTPTEWDARLGKARLINDPGVGPGPEPGGLPGHRPEEVLVRPRAVGDEMMERLAVVRGPEPTGQGLHALALAVQEQTRHVGAGAAAAGRVVPGSGSAAPGTSPGARPDLPVTCASVSSASMQTTCPQRRKQANSSDKV